MCRPDGRHVLNNQGTDDYVLTLNLSTEYILFGTGPSINDRIFLQSINKCPEEKKEYLLLILNKIIESYNIDTKTV